MQAISLFVEEGFPLPESTVKRVAGAVLDTVLDTLKAAKCEGFDVDEPCQVEFYAKASMLLCGVMAARGVSLGAVELRVVPGGMALRPLTEAEFWMVHRDDDEVMQ